MSEDNVKIISPISSAEIERAELEQLSNRPNNRTAFGAGGLSAEELKRRFSALPKLAIQKINEMIALFGKGDTESALLGFLYVSVQDEKDDEKRMSLADWVERIEALTQGGGSFSKDEIREYVGEVVNEILPGVYVGEHVVIPKVSEQTTLDTARKVVQEDIVVEPIPYSEVSNATNGKTVTIG